MSEAIWLIWSNEHGRWWAPGRMGYRAFIGQAGRYTIEEASQIVEDANRYQGEHAIPNEVKVLAPEATDRLIGGVVDRIVTAVLSGNAQKIEDAKRDDTIVEQPIYPSQWFNPFPGRDNSSA